MTANQRLTNAVRSLGRGWQPNGRFTIAVLVAGTVAGMLLTGRQVPGELWVAFGMVVGFYFPRATA